MVFFLITMLVSAAIIYFGSSLLEWILEKVAAAVVRSLGPVGTVVVTVGLMTAIYLFVMTRPAIVGPYEQWTFENIGGQLIAGVLVAGLKIWMRKRPQPS